MLYNRLIKPILFKRDAEEAHELAIDMLARTGALGRYAGATPFTAPELRVDFAGVSFPNPVGLAAGCDKSAKAAAVWPHFGFGFVEVGTITAQPQPGNPKPRVFRLPEQRAVINRLGFNSEGSEAVAARIKQLRERRRQMSVPLFINIGKTKVVTEEQLVLEDYRTSLRRLAPYADLLVINVSSPNTPGLRMWQERSALTALLAAVTDEARKLDIASHRTTPTPILVKISPDMVDQDMVDVLEVSIEQKLAGVIATNTTISRPEGLASITGAEKETGGLSGQPLTQRANEVMRFLYRESGGRIPLVGVGGIASAEDAYHRIRAGASLVQIYTGLIYEGPYLPRRVNRGLLALLKQDGLRSISEAVGVDA